MYWLELVMTIDSAAHFAGVDELPVVSDYVILRFVFLTLNRSLSVSDDNSSDGLTSVCRDHPHVCLCATGVGVEPGYSPVGSDVCGIVRLAVVTLRMVGWLWIVTGAFDSQQMVKVTWWTVVVVTFVTHL